jgi:dTDP-4-dehydrorhamnose 3,5-epimerase
VIEAADGEQMGIESRATELAVHQTAIAGLSVIDLVVRRDRRGWFKENYQREKLEALGMAHLDIVQNNLTFNEDVGVTRGIHAEPWDKYISVACGRVFVAIVDLRAGADFGRLVTLELSVDKALFVPRGCGNSYQTLEREVVYTYLVNELWSPGVSYPSVNLFDEELAIDWPIPQGRAICSDQDLAHPALSSITPL